MKFTDKTKGSDLGAIIVVVVILAVVFVYISMKQSELATLKQSGRVIYSGQTFKYLNKTTNQIVTIDWGSVAKMPESSANEKLFKKSEAYRIVDLITSLGLPQQEQTNIIQELRLDQNDVGYYKTASRGFQDRLSMVINKLKQEVKNTSDFTKIIVDGKLEVNGKAIVTQDILDELLREGYINNSFKNYLDSFKYNSSTNKVESTQTYQPQGQKMTLPEYKPTKLQYKPPQQTNCYPNGVGGFNCTTY